VEAAGTNLDLATREFLDETNATRVLQIKPSSTGEYALTVLDFVDYLGLDLEIEPELTWISREMCNAPMPPNAEMIISKSNIVYFHDLENDYYTLEHPLTQRYLKVLERSRVDVIALRTKPAVCGLVFGQPDIIFQQQFRNLQLPCQDCGVVQSTAKCNQCLQSYCQGCFDNHHKFAVGPKKDHTVCYTAVGSFCSSCNVKKPQVFCGNCEDYFCFLCFEAMHKKGFRSDHRAMLVAVSDGEVIETGVLCDECEDNPAAFHCDYCRDNFCLQCFWKCHFNGHRREHTVTKISVAPLCSQCANVRATVFDEQEQELLCTDCFTFLHCKGNRQLHLFLDCTNLLLLLERLDPAVQEHLRRARPRVMWAITKLQGWTRGIEQRRTYRRRRDLIMKVQRRWRGAMTRQKLLNMLDHYKWRRKQIHNYFLPKSRIERQQAKRKFQVAVAQKEVSAKATKSKLGQLKEMILETAGANPLEDPARTAQEMSRSRAATSTLGEPGSVGGATLVKTNQKPLLALPVFAPYNSNQFLDSMEENPGETVKTKTGDDFQARLAQERTLREEELTNKDIRNGRDLTMRQMLRIDNRPSGDPQERYKHEKENM